MINEIYVYLGVGPDGEEGIAAYLDPETNVMTPLAGSLKGVPRMETMARALEEASGVTLALVKFSRRGNLERPK